MKKHRFIILLVVGIFCFSGCAGMPAEYNRNMSINAGTWGIIGAGTAAAIAVATDHDVGDAAILGGVAGAYVGAGNTPYPADKSYSSSYLDSMTEEERLAYERGRAQRQQNLQRQRVRRAYERGYYGY